ncbi:hypothetical protein V5O48_010466 [Marasmius crinis-equi]|uniref:F-box domain-containing protein n=1 Tax=Marasmius crinis-equi TaxID=585013 RepID=A0ABR3F8D6_9AGAR
MWAYLQIHSRIQVWLGMEYVPEQLVDCGREMKSIQAPTHRVPEEILYCIFSMCCEGGTEFELPGRVLGDIPVPFTLSMVCTHWREVAISSEILWSNMQFTFRLAGDSDEESTRDSGEETESERCLRVVEMFLERAGGSLLSLSFGMLDRIEITNTIECILYALCRRASQWGSVSFSAPSPSFIRQPAFQLITGNLRNLHTILVDEFNDENDPNVPLTLDFLGPCPALRKAKLDLVIERPGGSQTLPIPWAQLTSLNLCADAPAPSQILLLCSSLINLELGRVGGYAGGVWDTVMPTLRSLKVDMTSSNGSSAVFPHFFQIFTFPQLTSLDLRSWSEHSEDDLACLAGFFQRLSPSLTTLTLCCALEGAYVFRLLQLLPHLTSLHLIGKYPYPNPKPLRTLSVFPHLKASSSEPSNSILPHLLYLKISVTSISVEIEDYEPFVDVVRSRWIPDPELATELGVDCLRSVELLFLDKATYLPRPLAKLEILRDAGLRVILPMLPLGACREYITIGGRRFQCMTSEVFSFSAFATIPKTT